MWNNYLYLQCNGAVLNSAKHNQTYLNYSGRILVSPSKINRIYYRISGKFGEFGVLSAIRQTKLVLTINNLLVDLLIHQTFFRQMLKTSQFAKLSPHQIFPLYSTLLRTTQQHIQYCFKIKMAVFFSSTSYLQPRGRHTHLKGLKQYAYMNYPCIQMYMTIQK